MRIGLLVGLSLIMGACSNAAYHETAAQPSEITGVYSKSRIFFTSTNTTVIKLNADGTGFNCFYSNDKPQPQKTPIKHLGGDEWAAATLGSGVISMIGNDSIKWGMAGIFAKTNIDDTSCK